MLKVLIADDEEKICQLIIKLINWEEMGLKIAATASNGIEALEQAKICKPEILITDIRMPGIDGMELIRKVKEKLPDTEIIIISGYSDFSYARKAIQEGVSDYILKPVGDSEILEKVNDKFEYKVFWGCDLQTEHERYLTEQVYKRPVFVTDYPKEIKAFYMKQNEDGKTVAAMDCLVPGIGEIIGGSQREDSYEKLKTRMDELGLNEEDYGFYLDLRKYGSTRHSGFGLGFERCVMYLTGMQNIRDVIPFPRTVNNCDL